MLNLVTRGGKICLLTAILWVLSFWFFGNITHWAIFNFNSSSPYYSPWQCTLSNPVYNVNSNWKSYLTTDYVWCESRTKNTPNYSDDYSYDKYISVDTNNSKCILKDWSHIGMLSSGECDWRMAYKSNKIELNKTFEYDEDIKAKSCYRTSQTRVRWNYWGYQLTPNPRYSESCWN